MRYALFGNQRIAAVPGARAVCPGCGQPVLAKCGSINAWHWAHEARDCDPWNEPESAWHLGWKAAFPQSRTEVVMGPHRADIVTPAGRVIELQASSISSEEIREREQFYRNMIWVFRADTFRDNLELRQRSYGVSFRWKHPRKSLWACQRPMYWDLGTRILAVRKVHPKIPCGGYGELFSREGFIAWAEGRAERAQ